MIKSLKVGCSFDEGLSCNVTSRDLLTLQWYLSQCNQTGLNEIRQTKSFPREWTISFLNQMKINKPYCILNQHIERDLLNWMKMKHNAVISSHHCANKYIPLDIWGNGLQDSICYIWNKTWSSSAKWPDVKAFSFFPAWDSIKGLWSILAVAGRLAVLIQ